MTQQLMIVMKKLLSMSEIDTLIKRKFRKRIVTHFPKCLKELEQRLIPNLGIINKKPLNFMNLISKHYRKLKIRKNKKENWKKIISKIRINKKMYHLLNNKFNK
jgi:hypothetical protein